MRHATVGLKQSVSTPPNTIGSKDMAKKASATLPKGIIPAGRPGVPNPIDIHVGGRVRLRRTLLGMSQEKLGEMIGLTFQQVQKYERGANRIGASRLYDLSRVLDVPIQFFYEDMSSETAGQSPRLRAGLSDASSEVLSEMDPMKRRETLELIRAYYRIKDETVRKGIYDLCRAMAHSGDSE